MKRLDSTDSCRSPALPLLSVDAFIASEWVKGHRQEAHHREAFNVTTAQEGHLSGFVEDGVLKASTSREAWLENLPNELLGHIISYLDSQPPSELNFNQQPGHLLTKSETRYLKIFSSTSKRFRLLVLPLLFNYARFDPYQLREFLEFIVSNELSSQVKSIVASLQGPCNHLHPAWWARLLNAIPCQIFSIICAPHIFAEFASTSIVSSDSWAFNMPHQTVQFRQDAGAARQHISLNYLPSLLNARPWIGFRVNEGSSLKAYTTYEYFLRRTPSLMATLHESKSGEADLMYINLTSFSFTAIFPFYNHVEVILKSVRKMKKLKHLSTKLCPAPESTVLHDEIEEAQGHIEVNDPWSEFDTAYALVSHTAMFLVVEGELEELIVDDIKMEGIRESLETSITTRMQELMWYEGNGVWRRIKKRRETRDKV